MKAQLDLKSLSARLTVQLVILMATMASAQSDKVPDADQMHILKDTVNTMLRYNFARPATFESEEAVEHALRNYFEAVDGNELGALLAMIAYEEDEANNEVLTSKKRLTLQQLRGELIQRIAMDKLLVGAIAEYDDEAPEKHGPLDSLIGNSIIINADIENSEAIIAEALKTFPNPPVPYLVHIFKRTPGGALEVALFAYSTDEQRKSEEELIKEAISFGSRIYPYRLRKGEGAEQFFEDWQQRVIEFPTSDLWPLRAFVVGMMDRFPEFRDAEIVESLACDDNVVVAEIAKSTLEAIAVENGVRGAEM